jgi:hypothetical protein
MASGSSRTRFMTGGLGIQIGSWWPVTRGEGRICGFDRLLAGVAGDGGVVDRGLGAEVERCWPHDCYPSLERRSWLNTRTAAGRLRVGGNCVGISAVLTGGVAFLG